MSQSRCPASLRPVSSYLRRSRPTHRFLCAAACLLPLGQAAAQPVLEEILVTAQKRTQSLQETPISLAVFDEAGIERLGITNIGDIQNLVPNLSIIPFGVSPTTLRIYIRGIGTVDSQITQDPPVGVYMDGVYMARNSGLAMDVAEIERIEVLRGPQGTLYGRNTTGGAINVITRRPGDEFEFAQLFSFGRFSEVRSRSMLNLPLTDQLAARLVYQRHDRDGWIRNTGEGEDFHAYDKEAMRGDLRWQPGEGITVDYTWDRSVSDFGGSYYHLVELNPDFDVFFPDLAGTLERQRGRASKAELALPFRASRERTSGHALTVSIDTPVGELRSITAYRELKQNAYQDYSANPDISFFVNDPFRLDQEQWSQELQLVGSTNDGRFDYVAGVYYFEEEGTEDALDRIPLFGVDLPRRIDVENRAVAAYGEVTWHPEMAPDWSITVGGRYTRDRRKADNNIDPRTSAKFNNFTPSLTVNYAIDDVTSVYAKVVTGYKSGGFNLRQANFADGFDEEELISYEVGWKSELMQRRIRFNGALFYADYDDIQLDILVPDQPDPTLTITENAGEAEIWGLETDITAMLTSDLLLSFSYGYLNTDVKSVVGDDANLYELPNAPKHSLTAGIDWTLARTRAGELSLAVDYAWRDDYQTGVRRLVGIDVDAYSVTNARLTLTGSDWFAAGEYRVALWVKNAFDKEYFADTFGSFNGLHANRVATYGDPRTYGIDLEYRFR